MKVEEMVQRQRNSMASEESQLQTRVAWSYYNEGQTQAAIAQKYGVTRAKVNKILQECRASGLVQIIINSDEASCAEVEGLLEQRFGLMKAIVVPTPAKESHLHAAIGETAGTYVSKHLRDGQGLGIGWGKTLRASLEGVVQRPPSMVSIVSLFGGLPRSETTNPYDVAAVFSRRLNVSKCHYIAAPMYVTSEQVRKILMSQPMFEHIFEKATEVDMALIGAGDLTQLSTNVLLGALTDKEWKSLLDANSVGEVFGYFLDKSGQPIDHPINRRFMGADLSCLKQIPIKIVASGGIQKVSIIKAVLEGGYADILVTDEVTAWAVYNS